MIKREVSLGQYLNVGDKVATLYSTDRIDINVSIANTQWALLPKREELLGFNKVLLSNTEGETWFGTVTEVSQHIDSINRQKSLVVSVVSPLSKPIPLPAGTFLTVSIPATSGKNLLAVPASSLTSKGDVWYVDESHTLQRFSPKIVFQQQGQMYLELPDIINSDMQQALPILTRPLPSYTVGQHVVSKARLASVLLGAPR